MLPSTTDGLAAADSGLALTAASSSDPFKGFTVHIPKKSIPFPTPSSSKNHPINPSQTTKKPSAPTTNRIPLPPIQSHPSPPIYPTAGTQSPPQSYAQKAKANTNKSLQQLAPLTYSEAGIPQVTIPDEVFQRGAELHKDFIQGFFFAKMPSFQALQSVLNFMWGKGSKLDIRTNPKAHSFLVRIPNDYIRAKVLEKKNWYVGTAMFQVSSWNSSKTDSVPLTVPTSLPLWAHLKGLPLDLRSLEGLSFAAGLIGEPKETDEFTKNLTDLELAHVKIEADLSKPLPDLIELRRTNGEIIPVEVSYPWIPPSCSHCRELGHIMKDCLSANPTWVEKKNSPQQQAQTQDAPATTGAPHQAPAQVAPVTITAVEKVALDNYREAPNSVPIIPMDTSPEDQQNFESDLLEILSPDHSSSPSPSLPLSPLVLASNTVPDPPIFLPVSHSKKPPPPKLKPSLKRPHSSSPPSLTLFNPFTLLEPKTKLPNSLNPLTLLT